MDVQFQTINIHFMLHRCQNRFHHLKNFWTEMLFQARIAASSALLVETSQVQGAQAQESFFFLSPISHVAAQNVLEKAQRNQRRPKDF